VSKINIGRCIAGGIAAGALIWIVEGAASLLYMEDMQARLTELGLSMEMAASTWVLTVLVSCIVGLFLTFLYTLARSRFGPGPKTAVIVAVATWFGSHFVALIGYHMVDLYPVGMLAMWGAVGLVELILAAMLGGWIYREPDVAIPAAR
jgi:hypothetical protein